jgi:hypothetical protein
MKRREFIALVGGVGARTVRRPNQPSSFSPSCRAANRACALGSVAASRLNITIRRIWSDVSEWRLKAKADRAGQHLILNWP